MSYKENIINETNMIFVEGGTFLMGAIPKQDLGNDEKPVHKVTLDSFYIGANPVTCYLWKEIMGDKENYFSKHENLNRPVTYVNWFEIQEFLYNLNDLTGKKYSLPTEAQWEFAARGGNKSKGYKYSGSDHINDVAWYNQNINIGTSLWDKPSVVGQKKPNELGLYDMSGNVYEWCKDFYAPYTENDKNNPCCEIGENDPEFGIRKIMRGGSIIFGSNDCQVSYRSFAKPNSKVIDTGFRLVENI